MAQGKHLLPFRTQKLSLAAVTILRLRGKIARCRVIKNETLTGLFFYTFQLPYYFPDAESNGVPAKAAFVGCCHGAEL